MVKIAVCQMSGHEDKQVNIDKAKGLIAQAVDQGAKIVGLQELFNTTYFCFEENPRYYDWAEPVDGPTIRQMQEVARKHHIVLIAPIYERLMPGELYNTAVFIDPEGKIMGIYRKSSIPMVKSPSLMGSEKYYFKPGNTGFPTFKTPFGLTIGAVICYDRHFPEYTRALALNGADVIFIPTATCGMSRYLWEIELQAHAIDNICYVAGVNRVGRDIGGAPDQAYYGSSFVSDFKGRILAQANDTDDAVVTADVDASAMYDLRNEWGFFRDRRPDLVGILTQR